jgi:hypothetical protein
MRFCCLSNLELCASCAAIAARRLSFLDAYLLAAIV